MTARAVWQLAVAAALLVLLVTLATVQYRWLGDVSDAERERLRASVAARAAEFAADVDREATNLFATFHVAADAFERDPAGALADAYARARRPGSGPSLVKAVYVVGVSPNRDWVVQRLDVGRRMLDRDDASALPFIHRGTALSQNGGHPVLLADSIDAVTPALIIGMPTLKALGDLKRFTVLSDPEALLRLVVVVLDENALRQQLVEPSVAAHFGSGASAEYVVTIVRRANPTQIVYSSDPRAPVDEKAADVALPVFTLRPDPAGNPLRDLGPPGRKEQVSVTIVRRAEGLNGDSNIVTATDVVGAWRLLIRGKAGSLDALVARSRRRNLAISLGILGLLGASFVLIIASAQRQHRLARQQMEFVAAVSHELRTPLAVICSAGENLADGVVADREQVRTYGALVQTEGRRLADMVERVMEFAGIASGTRRAHAEVDLAKVLADATNGVSVDARQRQIAMHVRAGALPCVFGDADALRSAIQNVIANAIKYSAAGGTVHVDLTTDDYAIQLRVVDHGIGIDRDELSKIFKPFFRGRRALDAQVRGTGVGLSVVRHVVDAHGGTIQIESEPGEGTTVTIVLQRHEVRHLVAREAHQVS